MVGASFYRLPLHQPPMVSPDFILHAEGDVYLAFTWCVDVGAVPLLRLGFFRVA